MVNNNLNNNAVFICNDEKVISVALFNDLIFDPGAKGEDEPILMALLNQDNYFSCTKPDMIPCMEGHSKCYHIKDICTYKLSLYKYLVPCTNGGHLEIVRILSAIYSSNALTPTVSPGHMYYIILFVQKLKCVDTCINVEIYYNVYT